MLRTWKVMQATAGVLGIALGMGLFSTGVARGQAVSQMSGTVRDDSGAIVPGVQVTATQTDTDLKRTVVTGAAGDYVLTNLQLGPYRLEASKMGFRTYVQTGIELQVGSAPEIPIPPGRGQGNEVG